MTDAMYHAKCLRAIGQDLENKRIIQFSLSSSEDGYLVRMQPRESGGDGLSGAKTHGEQTHSAPSSQPTEYLYTIDAIERLDEIGRTKRGMGNGMPDFFSLSQCLRALGAVIDAKRGQLLQVDRDARMSAAPSFSIRFQTSAGEQVRENHTLPNLYDCCVHLYKARKPAVHEEHLAEARLRQ